MANPVTDIQAHDYERSQVNHQVQFTPEELKAWQECLKNSSVIIPTLLSAVVGYGVCKITPLHAKANYAALLSGFFGLISNRINISIKCVEKAASTPNSNLKERLREAQLYNTNKSRSLHYKGFQTYDVQPETQTSEESSTEVVFDDYPPMNSYDTYSSFNDSSDTPVSSEEKDLTEPINMQKNVTYNELRDKNREDFYHRNKQWYAAKRQQSAKANEPSAQVSRSQEPNTDTTPSTQQKNKYGDTWG